MTEVNDSSDKACKAKPGVKPAVDMTDPANSDAAKLAKPGGACASLPRLEIGSAPTASGVKPSLSVEAATQDAKLIQQSFGTAWNLWHNDTDTISRILNPLNAADRKLVEDQYQKLTGGKSTLRGDLLANLHDGVPFRTIEGMLNRPDDHFNTAGSVRVALATMTDDPDKGLKLLRATMIGLNSTEMARLDADYRSNYGMGVAEAIKQSGKIDDADRAILGMLMHTDKNGKYDATSDVRTPDQVKTMAATAVAAGDLRMFSDVVGQDTASARTARAQLAADTGFMDKFNGTFVKGASWTTSSIAKDLMSEGHISLATIAAGDTGTFLKLFDNPKNVELAVANATDEERANFGIGADLAFRQAAPRNPQEKAALDYYNKVHQAFTAGSDARNVSIWEDELKRGTKTLITNLAELGKNPSAQALFSTIENMSESDWKLLHDPKSGAQYKQELFGAAFTYMGEDQFLAAQRMIQAKAAAPTFADSQNIRRSFEQIVANNLTSTGVFGHKYYDQAVMSSTIASLSPADAARYKNDADFRQWTDKFVNDSLDGPAKYLAQSLLKQVGDTGKPPKLGNADQVALDMATNADPTKLVNDIQTLLEDKQLRDRLNAPYGQMTPEDRQLRQVLAQAIPGMGLDHALKEGQLYPGDMISMGANINQLYEQFAKFPPEMRNAMGLSDDQRAILNNALAQNGKLDLADRMRAYIVDPDGNYSRFKDELAKLNPQQREDLKNEYNKKYGGDLDNDFLKQVKEGDSLQMANLLRPTDADPIADLNENIKRYDPSGLSVDGTTLTVLRALEQDQSLIAHYQALKQKLPPNAQQALDQYFSDAVQQYKDSKTQFAEKVAEVVVDATFIAIALAAAPATGGMSVEAIAALIPEIAAAGGAYRAAVTVAIKSAVEGNDSTISIDDIAKQYAIGMIQAGSIPALGAAGKLAKGLLTAGTESAEVVESGAVVSSSLPANSIVSGSVVDGAAVVGGETAAVVDGTAVKVVAQNLVAGGETAAVVDNVAAKVVAQDVVAGGETAAVVDGAATKVVAPEVVAGGETAAVVDNAAVKLVAPEVVVGGETAAVVDNAAVKFVAPEVVVGGETAAVVDNVAAKVVAPEVVVGGETAAVVDNVAAKVVAPEVVVGGETAAVVDNAAVKVVAPEVVAGGETAAVVDNAAVKVVAPEVVVGGETAAVVDNAAVKVVAPEVVAGGETAVAKVVAPEVVAGGETAVAKVVAQDVVAGGETAVAKVVAQDVVAGGETAVAKVVAQDVVAGGETAVAKVVAQDVVAGGETAVAKVVAQDVVAGGEAVAADLAGSGLSLTRAAGALAAAVVPAKALIDAVSEDRTDGAAINNLSFAPAAAPSQKLIDLATVRRGEGPWQSAERILRLNGHKPSVDEVRALTKAIQAVYSTKNPNDAKMGSLKVKYNLIDSSNFQKIVTEVGDQKVRQMLLQAAAS